MMSYRNTRPNGIERHKWNVPERGVGKHVYITVLTRALVAACLADGLLVAGEPARPTSEAQQLKARMLRAYRETETYVATTTSYAIDRGSGAVTRTPEGAKEVFAYDRAGSKLQYESTYPYAPSPERAGFVATLLIVADGDKLRLRTNKPLMRRGKNVRPSGLHMEVDQPQSLDYLWLMQYAVPLAESWDAPYVAALLGYDPIAVLKSTSGEPDGLRIETAPPRAEDRKARAGLRITGFKSKPGWNIEAVTYWLDPETHLVTQVTTDTKNTIGVNDFEVRVRNAPIAGKHFTFDTTDSKPVSSFAELAGRSTHRLVGQPAPQIHLQTMAGRPFKLADVDAEVVILDFWTTWCAFCPDSLRSVQKLVDWAKEHEKPVAAYAVNVEELPAQARAFWRTLKLTLPVLMDTDGNVADEYGRKGLPYTVIVHEGRIVHAAGGSPRFVELRLTVERLLATDESGKPARNR